MTTPKLVGGHKTWCALFNKTGVRYCNCGKS